MCVLEMAGKVPQIDKTPNVITISLPNPMPNSLLLVPNIQPRLSFFT